MENDQLLSEIKSVLSDMQAKYDAGLESEGNALNETVSQLEQKLEAIETAQKRSEVESMTEEVVQSNYENEFKSWIQSGDATEVKAAEWNTTVDESAGFLVPNALVSKVFELRDSTNAMRRVANKETITCSNVWLFNNEASESEAGFSAETQARPNTAVSSFAQGKIDLHPIYAAPKVTPEQLADTPNAEQWLARVTGRAVSKLEGGAFIDGDGVNRPKGIQQFLSADSTVAETHDEVAVVDAEAAVPHQDDILKLQEALDPFYTNGGIYAICNRKTLGAYRRLKDGENRYLVDVGRQMDGKSIITTLYDIPFLIDDTMPDIGSGSVPIIMGSFQDAYTIVDKGSVRTIRDIYSDRAYLTLFSEWRVGGHLTNGRAVKGLKFA